MKLQTAGPTTATPWSLPVAQPVHASFSPPPSPVAEAQPSSHAGPREWMSSGRLSPRGGAVLVLFLPGRHSPVRSSPIVLKKGRSPQSLVGAQAAHVCTLGQGYPVFQDQENSRGLASGGCGSPAGTGGG